VNQGSGDRRSLEESEAECPPDILVAEDDDDFRALVVGWFSRIRARILSAKDGRELVSVFNRVFSPAHALVIVTDIDMPRLDGLTAIRLVRKRSLSVPIIAISGRVHTEAERTSLFAAGANFILQKPFRGADLLSIVRRALRPVG
jgi:CheY-like chemotaxis protein